MEIFDELGNSVEGRWKSKNYGEDAFPKIAADALREANLHQKVDPWEIIRWVHTSPSLPEQRDIKGRFGDPPITLFIGSRFYIDIYYWLDGTTSIHQHAFSGAFQVLLGSSIHSHYNFREERIINEHFSVGEIRLKDVELLKKGDIKKIRPGKNYIHSLFHLDRPSATITIRTESTPSVATQYDYRKPHVASDPFYQNPRMVKQSQTVSLLLAMKHKDADSFIGDLVASSDFQTAYFVLAETFRYLRSNKLEALFDISTSKDRFDAILKRARSAHGALTDLVTPVLEEEARQRNIIDRRSSIIGEEHRFLLALLLNVPDKERIITLIRSRFPERDSVKTVLDWVNELAHIKIFGSQEANVLGIDGFHPKHLRALEQSLKGTSDENSAELINQLRKSPLSVLVS